MDKEMRLKLEAKKKKIEEQLPSLEGGDKEEALKTISAIEWLLDDAAWEDEEIQD